MLMITTRGHFELEQTFWTGLLNQVLAIKFFCVMNAIDLLLSSPFFISIIWTARFS